MADFDEISSQELNFPFITDLDLLRTDPQVVLRKFFTHTVNKINSIERYKFYGRIKLVLETTNPHSTINKFLTNKTAASRNVFYEYIVFPIDLTSPQSDITIETYKDLYKTPSLIRCGSRLQEKIPIGTIVELQYDDNSKKEVNIINICGDLPPVLNNDSKNASINSYKNTICKDAGEINSKSDFINSSSDIALNSENAPTPNFKLKNCENQQENISLYNPENDEKISKYFTLNDLIKSSMAKRQNINNQPSDQQKERLSFLANNILDSLVERYGPNSFIITNCFRSESLNIAVKGSSTSQHVLGTAVDLKFVNINNENIFNRFDEIAKSNLNFDQLIFESNGPGSFWFHISVAHPTTSFTKNRKQILSYGGWTIINNKKTYKSYNRQEINLFLSTNSISLTDLA